MFGQGIRGLGRISLVMLAVALMSLLAVTILARPDPAAIPARLVDRVRGENPNWTKVANDPWPDCTSWNVYEANLNLPPAQQFVNGFNGCVAANTPCITCRLAGNYIDQFQLNTANPVNTKLFATIDCDNPGGLSGTCQVRRRSKIVIPHNRSCFETL